MFLQAIVLYEDVKFFVEGSSNEFLPYIGSSVAWEQLGKYDKAARELNTGILLMHQEAEATQDGTITSVLPAFTAHLDELRQQATTRGNQSIFGKSKEKSRLQSMLYVGGMYTSSIFSFNSRFGVFFADSWNAAADLGIAGGVEDIYVNAGVSMYGRFKFLVGGIGLSGQINESAAVSIRFTSGFSFLNKRGSKSTDIFFTADVPLQEGVTVFGISFGQTFYFGKRKGK
jgi:hypothetical protein